LGSVNTLQSAKKFTVSWKHC